MLVDEPLMPVPIVKRTRGWYEAPLAS